MPSRCNNRQPAATARCQPIYIIPLTFDTDTHMAISWEPMDGIVLEPLIQFGAPCIKGTRIPARTVGGMVKAGDSAEWVAQAFEIDLGLIYLTTQSAYPVHGSQGSPMGSPLPVQQPLSRGPERARTEAPPAPKC